MNLIRLLTLVLVWRLAVRVLPWIAPVVLLVLLGTVPARAPRENAGQATITVQRWTDGDTLHTTQGLRVRLIGIDAPEASPSERARSQARRLGVPLREVVRLGLAARHFAESLAPAGTTLHLEQDAQATDRYGRVLAYLWTVDRRLVQEEILRAGWADLLTVPPNVRYADRLRAAWREARENRRGMWR